jgi:hypothetical protein
MLVSIVMAMFSNPESGSLACHPFYRRPAASMVSACFGGRAEVDNVVDAAATAARQ